MWKDPEPDPGGAASKQPSPQLTELKEQNEQQQVLIAQLKEMLRKTEQSSVTQEKVEEYVNTLNKVKAKRSKQKKGQTDVETSTSNVGSNKTTRVNLLKQQLEENKAKIAERGKNQKGIEEMVTQLKAQLNDSQQLIHPLGVTSIDPSSIDYDKNTPSEELYNILLTKEKRISELLAKTTKLEANVLDLQENVKEKDSVIDARTKAITLMTESLSKKGKRTVDELVDTKEQMRKMQESFIIMENEMKNRQMKLLDDLKLKNIEIGDLQEANSVLFNELESLRKTVKSDEVDSNVKEFEEEKQILLDKLEAAKKELEEYKNSNAGQLDENEEVMKLKKQLEESNKSMIKIKAQNKSKLKELNKRLEAFKKMSDSNALIAQLQSENSNLSQKIAELEEEKLNAQLKMVESADSFKEFTKSDEIKELEDKISQYVQDLEEKDKIISLLDTEISNLKTEVKALNERQTIQVSSEINSIQIEEQLEKVQSEKEQVLQEKSDLIRERDELLEKCELLTKEKLELSSKLENYIQENIELIDKLEKLSAEKVSSAESIEIVEGLTQQEKLELAAYQKGISELKPQDIDEPAELNESVSQLTEDSTELLQKINMFNMERKEVMSKMEVLKEENNQLILKLKEVENNRDVLEETYEQLQNEKESLLGEKQELEKKINELELPDNKNDSNKKIEELLEEKNYLETELYETKLRLEEKIKSSLEETKNFEMVIEENKEELIRSSELINELKENLSRKEQQLLSNNEEINVLNQMVNELQEAVGKLETENSKISNFEDLENHLTELKSTLDEQLQQARDYEDEINQGSETISLLNETITDLKKKLTETNTFLQEKNEELENLKQILDNKNSVIENLQDTLKEKDDNYHKLSKELTDKYVTLQKQLDGNNDSLGTKVEELTNKNKEQLEKMKKLAANLKKKTQCLQELEEKYKQDKEKWERELSEKDLKLEDSLRQLAEIEKQLINQNEEFKEIARKLEEQTRKTAEVEENNSLLNSKIIELKSKEPKVTQVNLRQELSGGEDNFFGASDLEAKIKELEMMLESQEAEVNHLRERCEKLEELNSGLEERQMSLEKENSELNEKLNETSDIFEEKSLEEEKLEQKYIELIAKDGATLQKLDDLNLENEELRKQNQELVEWNEKITQKLNVAQDEVQKLNTIEEVNSQLAANNQYLKEHIASLENTTKILQTENEQLKLEWEKNEVYFQDQINSVASTKNELNVKVEKLEELLKESNNKQQELLMDIEEYKSRVDITQKEANERIDSLSEELDQTIRSLQNLRDEHSEALEKVEELKKQVIVKEAEATVESVLTEATREIERKNSGDDNFLEIKSEVPQEVEETQTAPVLSNYWGEPQNSQIDLSAFNLNLNEGQNQFFETVGKKDVAPLGADLDPAETPNTKEELQKKIKALEFMLFNMEKEKEDALLQCHELSNELTRLVYERENSTRPVRTEADIPGIESQILPGADIQDTVESQIIQQNLEFEPVKSIPSAPSQEPIEEVFNKKEAYKTYTAEQAFGENDDGWGLGTSEVNLEEGQVQKLEGSNDWSELKAQIEQLNEQIRVYQIERENHLEEIKQLQVKSGKLIKKCKELKQKNEQLMKAQKGDQQDFFSLDDAIQDELKSQITSLEKKVKELSLDLEKEKNEKSNALKRVDVLTSANERMMEMKEKQDIELLHLQRKNEENLAKLEQFEWESDGFRNKDQEKTHIPPQDSVKLDELNKKIEELNDTIRDLNIDNEELQALLEEQRSLRINAEKANKIPQIDDNKLKEYDSLLESKNATEQELINVNEKLKSLENDIEELKIQNDELHETSIKLQESIKTKDQEIAQLNLRVTAEESQQNTDLISQIERLENDKKELVDYTQRIDSMLEEKVILINELTDIKVSLENEVSHLKNELVEAQKEKEQLLKKIEDKNNLLKHLEEDISRDKNHFMKLQNDFENQSELIRNLQNQLTKKEEELEEKIIALTAELEEKWAIEVEQRGATVAESWKLHLENVEMEFGAVKANLESELIALEEKCNGLVNENNELRKNVDSEIRNEVDRMSALQQQITDRQSQVNELNHSLQEKQNEIDLLLQQLNTIQVQMEEQTNLLKEKDTKLQSTDLIIDTIQKQFDEKREVVENIVRILERNTFTTLTYQKDDIVKEFERQLAQNASLESIQAELQQHKNLLESTQQELIQKQQEIDSSKQVIENYKTQVEKYQRLEQDLIEREKEIENLNQLLKESEMLKNDNNKLIVSLEEQISYLKGDLEAAQKSAADFQLNLTDVLQELEKRKAELESSTYQLQQMQMSYQQLEANYNSLQVMYNEKEREVSYAAEQSVQDFSHQLEEVEKLKQQLRSMESHYEGLLLNKQHDFESVQLCLQESEKASDELKLTLEGKVKECQELETKLSEQAVLLDEENKQLVELRGIIEEQVMKIEELKNELFEKSNDYDAIIAQMDINRTAAPTQQSSLPGPSNVVQQVPKEEDLSEPVSRAELDLALYMLHQRDVRCEELTVELTQLLEERDTLQLRLSNALREQEEFRRKLVNKEEADVSVKEEGALNSTASPSKSSQIFLAASGTELATEPSESGGSQIRLANKLSELRQVGYKKDKTFVDEQEKRRYQQMAIMQQHITEAAKLPPEAAAKLVDASYTLSRDVQSPSKVLLNWLWGRSTPKVNDT